MDTNHNSNNDSFLPKQPVIGPTISEKADHLSKSSVSGAGYAPVATDLLGPSTSGTIGLHNIASIRLAAGRSLSSTLSSPSSSNSSSSRSTTFVQLPNIYSRTTRNGSPATPAKIQFLILGSSGTGKTSLLRRLQNLNATSEASATIGPDLHRLKCGLVEAIDVGGSDACFPIVKAYAELSDVFLVIFDITSAESFLYARFWMDFIEQKTAVKKESHEGYSLSKRQPTILLIGNKKDLVINNTKARQVSRNMARNLAITFGAEYLEISARHDLTLTETVLDTLERKHEENLNSSINNS